MRKERLTIWLALFLSYFLSFYCGGDSSQQCQSNSDCPKNYTCSDGICSKASNLEKSSSEKAKKSEKYIEEKIASEISSDSTPSPDGTGDADTPDAAENSSDTEKQQFDENVLEEPLAGESTSREEESPDGSESHGEREGGEESSGCRPPMFQWKGRCVTPREFCTAKFSNEEQIHIQRPPSVVFDSSGKPLFCKTALGSYYIPKMGYRFCDRDGDGWINIGAYQALNSTDKNVRDNARCKLQKIEALVYHSDLPNATPQPVFMGQPLPLVETFRNDGFGKATELPLYTEYNSPLPKGKATACNSDADCNSSAGELCYIGHCVKGRRFRPEELNSFTKACIENIDLNDNQVDDPSETPNSSSKPPELAPYLKFGYFIELNYGYYQKDYNVSGRKMPVFHIFERSRREKPSSGGLALKCEEDPRAQKPDYWRYCNLKDDQRCKSSGGTAKRGLSHCWMDKVRHGTRSLFKCAVFDGKKDASTYFFHPHNFGLKNNYSRTSCRLKDRITGKAGNKDIEFDCRVEKGAPPLSRTSVGWACVSSLDYDKPANYLAGCINECTESKKELGALQPCGVNEKCRTEPGSYGRGVFTCDTGVPGRCKDSQNYCQWGKWTKCLQKVKPQQEDCNGKDDDCDGTIDESPHDPSKPLSRPCYTGTTGCKKDSKGNYRCTAPCKSGTQVCAMGHWESECIGEVKNQKEICNGKDDDCDGKVDEECRVFSRLYLSPIDIVPSSSRLNIGTPNVTPNTVCNRTKCPEGTVLIGLKIKLRSSSSSSIWIRKINYICAELKLKEDYSGSTVSYRVEFGKKTLYTCDTTNKIESFPNLPTEVYCPSGHVLVGFSGKSKNYIHQLAIWCSKVEIKKGATQYKLTLSPPKYYGVIGGKGGTPFKAKLCPIGTAITGLTVTYNNTKHSEITGIIANCSRLILVGSKIFGSVNSSSSQKVHCDRAVCPDGSVLIGIKVKHKRSSTSNWLRSITSICAEIKLKKNPTSTPFPYKLEFIESYSGECKSSLCCSSSSYMEKEAKCPPNYVLMGFYGFKGTYINQLTILCSKAYLTRTPTHYAVSISSTPTAYKTVGFVGGKIFPRKVCPKNSALNGLWISYDRAATSKNKNEIIGFTAFCHRLLPR